MKPLSNLRILVCGKGGSGKSSVVALMGKVLQEKDYHVLLLDGDASNPGGLARLATGSKKGPKPLIDFFGGREKVTCPVDDPSPLISLASRMAVIDSPIDLNDIPPEYVIRRKKLVLMQVGKIQQACEGCDGPMSKVTRDFIVKGEYVTLIDVEAGIEHFGRGVEQNVNIVLIVVNPTFESFAIADRVTELCNIMGIKRVGTILNAVQSKEMESVMEKELHKREVEILGAVKYDPIVAKAGLEGTTISRCKALEDIAKIIESLDK